MIILSSLDEHYNKDMKLIVDKRTNDTKVVDSKLIQYAMSEEIIRLQGDVNTKMYVIVADLIANSLGLIDSERQLYITILANTRNVNKVKVNTALDDCCKVNGKSRLTYRRALDTLIRMGIAKYSNGRNDVSINSKYDAGSVNGHQAKFIVIELGSSKG